MNDRINYKLPELFYSILSNNLTHLRQLLSNKQDNKNLLKDTNKNTGNTLLLAAVDSRSLEAVSILIDHGAAVNMQNPVNKDYPIDISWRNHDYPIILKLLQSGSLFPQLFDLTTIRDQSSDFNEIKSIVNRRTALHQAIQHGNLATVQSTLKNSIPSKYYFNLDNLSALAAAAKLHHPEIYAYLLSIGTDFKNNNERNSVFESFTLVQKNQFRSALLPYFRASDESHILYLLSKSKSSILDTNFQERCLQYYEKLSDIPEISLIMQVIQYADHNNIVFYQSSNSVDNIDPYGASGDGRTSGTTNFLDGTIYIAAGGEESDILKTLAHEFTHQALLILYENKSNPYFSNLDLSKKDLEGLLQDIQDPINKTAFRTRMSLFLKNYPTEGHTEEIFPFLSELLLNRSKLPKDPLIKDLKDVYSKYLTDACKKFIETSYLIKPRSNIIAMEKFAGDGHILESSPIVLLKDKIKPEILKSILTPPDNKNVALITTDNLLLSSHKLYQEIQSLKDYSMPGKYLFLKFKKFTMLAKKIHEIFSSKMDPLLIVINPQGTELAAPLRILSESLNFSSKKIILLLKPQEVNSVKNTLSQLKLQNSYVEIIDETYTWDHLTSASQEKLLKKYCLFQGRQVPLYQLLEKELLQTPLAVGSATLDKWKQLLEPNRVAALRTLITPEVLLELVSSQSLIIGTTSFLNDDAESLFYEPRALQRAIVINPLTLLENPLQQSNLEGPLFVISGTPKTALLPPDSGYPFTQAMQGLPLSNRYFFISLENSEQWSQLCQYYPTRTLHYLKESNGKLIWRRSSPGSLASLQPYIDHSKTVHYDEGMFTQEENTQNLFILADEPSLGKTSFLHNLATNFKAANSQSWVLPIMLNNYGEQFNSYQAGPAGGVYHSQQAIDFLSNILLQLTNPLEKAIFKSRLQSSSGVSLLLDGLDDLSPTYKETAINFLKSLKDTQLDTLWITTRIHLKQELETQFNEVAYTLKPLSDIEASTLLSKIWQRAIPAQPNDAKILMYATYLTQQFRDLFRKPSLEFMGTPFLLKLLSTAYQPDLQKFLESPNSIPTSNIQSSLTTLYQQLIEKKLAIYFNDKLQLSSSNPGIRELRQSQTTSLQQAHQQLALRLLFPEIAALAPAPSFTDEALARAGLLELTDTGLKFIHPSIAEYCTADYFATQLVTTPSPVAMVDQLLTKLFSDPQYKIVRHFLNDQFIQNPPTLTATWNTQQLQQVSLRETTPLSLAAAEGHTAIAHYLQTSLSLSADQELVKTLVLKRGVGGSSCLHHAVLSGKLAIVDHIVVLAAGLGITQELTSLVDNKGETALHEAARFPEVEITQRLLRNLAPAQKVKLLRTKTQSGNTALQIAALNNDADTVQELLNPMSENERYYYIIMPDYRQNNALQNALTFPGNKKKLVELLLSSLTPKGRCTVITASNEQGTNSLQEAVRYQHTDVITLLLENVNPENRRYLLLRTDSTGNTVLHQAAERGNQAMAVALLGQADFPLQQEMLLAKNSHTETAGDLARSNNHPDLATFLRLAPSVIHWKNYQKSLKKLSLSLVKSGGDHPRCRRQPAGCGSITLDDPLLYDTMDSAKAGEASVRQANDYAQLALAVAWEQPQIFSNSPQESILQQQYRLAPLLKTTADNRSPEEQTLVENYSQRVSNLLEAHPAATLWQPLTADDSGLSTANRCWRFDNGHISLLVRFDGQRYQLYSANFKDPQHFQTAIGATFAEVETFVQALLLWHGSDPSYQRSVLKEPLPPVLSTHFEEDPLWQVESLLPKLPPASADIEGLPVQILRALFYLNGKTPDYSALDAQFFQPPNRLQFRADRLHEILPDLDNSQRQALSRLYKEHHWPVTGSNTPSVVQFTHVDDTDYPKLLTAYQQRVMTLLEQPESPTLEKLSQLSWDQLADYGTAHSEISEELMQNSLETLQDLQTTAAVHKSILSKETATQSLFFLPDFIRAANTGESANLRKMLGMTLTDTAINHAYQPLLDKLSPVLSPARKQLLGALGSSPLFKILTLYSIKELLQKKSSLPRNSSESQAIQEALGDQAMTIVIMVAECLGVASMPAWFTLSVIQWLNNANHLRHDQHLDVALWKAELIALGFEQDGVQAIFKERQLVAYIFDKVLSFNAYYPSPFDFVIPTVPLLQPRPWETINEQQVPTEIRKQINQGQTIVGGFRKAPLYSPTRFPGSRVPVNQTRTWQQRPYQVTAAETIFTIPLQPYYRRPYSPVNFWSDPLPDFLKPYNDTLEALNPLLPYFSKFITPLEEPGSIFLPINQENVTHYQPLMSTEFPNEYVELFPIKITGSRPAAFYSSEQNNSSTIMTKKIFFYADPREGNVTITTFASPWVQWAAQKALNHLQNINSKLHFRLTLFIDNKPYREPIRFQPNSTPSRITIQDNSGFLATDYLINNSSNLFVVDDTTASTVAFIPADNNTQITISSDLADNTRLNIRHQRIDSLNRTTYSANQLQFIGKKQSLQLNLQDVIIDRFLELWVPEIEIMNLQGSSDVTCWINFTPTVKTFNITIQGNIIIESSQTSLQVSGLIAAPYQPIRFFKQSAEQQRAIYILTTDNLAPLLQSLSSHTHPNLQFSLEMVQCTWEINRPVKAQLQIVGPWNNASADFVVQATGDRLTVYNQQHQPSAISLTHYPSTVRLPADLRFETVLHPAQLNDSMRQLTTSNLHRHARRHQDVLVFRSPAGYPIYHQFLFSPGTFIYNDIPYRLHQQIFQGVLDDQPKVETDQLLRNSSPEQTLVPLYFSKDWGNSSFSWLNSSLIINGVLLQGIPNETWIYFGNPAQGLPLNRLKEAATPIAINTTEPIAPSRQRRQAAQWHTTEPAPTSSASNRLVDWPSQLRQQFSTILRSLFHRRPAAPPLFSPPPSELPVTSTALSYCPKNSVCLEECYTWNIPLEQGDSGNLTLTSGASCRLPQAEVHLFLPNPRAHFDYDYPQQYPSVQLSQHSCKPLSWYQQPSVSCQNQQGTFIYTPELPTPSIMEQLDGCQFMLFAVAWQWLAKTLQAFQDQPTPSTASPLLLIEITDENIRDWQQQLTQLQQSLSSAQTFCENQVTLQSLLAPLPHWLTELQAMGASFSPSTEVALEKVTEFTDRLTDLTTELNEFKTTQAILEHLNSFEENRPPFSIASTVTKIKKMHHLIQGLTNGIEADPLFATHRLEQEIVNLAHLIQTFQELGIEPSVSYGLQSMMQELTENFSYLVGSPKG